MVLGSKNNFEQLAEYKFFSKITPPYYVIYVGTVPYLGYLWLVWCVLRGPARVLEYVAEDGVRGAGVVVPHTDVGPPDL